MSQIKLRRDTYANFTSSNPVLGSGEPAYETDTKKLKIGDGSTAYTQLDYFSSSGGGGSVDITATLPLKIDENGVISLEVDGQTIQIVDGKLHANLDELGNEVNDLSGRVTANEADILTIQEDITDLSGQLDSKEDKFTPVSPLGISSGSISSTVGSNVTETETSYSETRGVESNGTVSVDISDLNINANSNWTLHLSGYMGDWSSYSNINNQIGITTEKRTIFYFWFGSKQFRLGNSTDVFNNLPQPSREFYYEITYNKNATQYTFQGTNLANTTPMDVSTMETALGHTPVTDLKDAGKLTKITFTLYSHCFRRIDKDISKSYLEADGVRYPLTPVEGSRSLKLNIGDGLSVTDGKLTATAQTPSIATTSAAGIVKPDGTTITVTDDGTLSSTGSSVPDNMVTTDTDQIIKGSKVFISQKTRFNNGFILAASSAIYTGDINNPKALFTYTLTNLEIGHASRITNILGSQVVDSNKKIFLTQGNVTAGDNISIENTNTGIKIDSKQIALTQSEYDALTTKDENTSYLITDATGGGSSSEPEFYQNETSGYILYPNGFCIQYFSIPQTSATSYTVMLLKTMKDTNYVVNVTAGSDHLTTGSQVSYQSTKTTTSCKVISQNILNETCDVIVIGYVS